MVGRNIREHPFFANQDLFYPNRESLDLLNYENTAAYVKQIKPDFVIHAAGKVGGIQANIREPVKFMLDNFNMGQNVISAAASAGVNRLINLGSSCMYPGGYDRPLREKDVLTGELEPSNEGYALAKISIARLCQYYEQQDSRLQYKTIIPCNLYGRFDTFDPERSHLIPSIIHKIDKAKKNRYESVEIWGSGTARREFMYAGDLADFLSIAIKRYEELPQIINVGLGYDYSILDYYRAVAEVMNYTGGFAFDRSKPVGMLRKTVDTTGQKLLDWEPRFSLSHGLKLTCSFYSDIKNL